MPSSSRGSKGISLVLGVLLVALSTPRFTATARDDIRVENVNFKEIDGKIVIYYDLIGKTNKKYKVTVSLRRKADRFFRHSLVVLTGDVGTRVFAGRNRKITWDLSKEFPEGLQRDDYYFIVDVELVSGGIRSLVWIGAAVAVLGGGAMYFLLSAQDEQRTPAVKTGFPLPPPRP